MWFNDKDIPWLDDERIPENIQKIREALDETNRPKNKDIKSILENMTEQGEIIDKYNEALIGAIEDSILNNQVKEKEEEKKGANNFKNNKKRTFFDRIKVFFGI